jgi:hypothetical protein
MAYNGFARKGLTVGARLDNRTWIDSLPLVMTLGNGLLLCHGTPDDADGYWLHRRGPGAMRKAGPDQITVHLTDHGLALCGHTHVPRVVQYDFERSAKRAEANGFPSWAYTLRTGRVRPRCALP